ncbi:MAG: hypothetical protein J7577_23135 [Sphingobacteriaceae bacterium]|nr:hypothetical protein [Sphingobacteriaceae bacterium]
MRNMRQVLPVLAGYFFALLFCYAAVSKILDFENFQVQIAQSPLLSAYAGFISYAVIITEVIIAFMLCTKGMRLIGLYLSLGIMVSFTVYIFIILNYSDFVPCSCGGILEKLGWTEHLIFNIVCVLLAIFTIYILQKQFETKPYKIFALALSVSAFSAAVVVGLFISSEHVIKQENNFTRRFLLHPVIEDKRFNLGINSYYFAGISDGKIYLGNLTAPLLLTAVDTGLRSLTQIRIKPDQTDFKFRNLQVQVKAPFYYLYDGSVPVIYQGRLGDTNARIISYRDAYFNQLVVIDSSKFAIRTQNSINQQYTLAGLNLSKLPKIELFSSILEKQVDGVFDSDGKIIQSYNSNKVIYTYAYRNEFIVMNSDLGVQGKLHTIDTTKIAKLTSKKLGDGKYKMAAPPLVVNKNQTANHYLLFNQSNLMGKHENTKAWKKASVIDIYKLDRQEYVGSFYVYNQKENKMSHMMATENYFFVMVGNELIRYHFRAGF